MKALAHRQTLLPKLLLVVFGISVGAVVAEVFLRITGYSYPEFYQLDYSRGYALRPGKEGRYRKEGDSYVRINSDGMRDREHSKGRAPDSVRIVVLGDSYSEAFQVAQEQAFWSVMQMELGKCQALKGKKVEAINFGVSGYSTAQELITLREHVWDYAPDIVLLTVTTNNDITDNSRLLKKTDEVPYFVLRNGALALDNSFQNAAAFRLRQSAINRLGRWLKDHLRLVQAINDAHHAFKIVLAGWKEKWKNHRSLPPAEQSTGAAPITEPGIDNLIYREPPNQIWIDAWAVTERLIEQMRTEVEDHGARFVLVTLTNPPQVLPNPEARQQLMKRLAATDLFYPDNRIKAFAESAGIQAFTLAPEMQAVADKDNVYLHGFGHDIGNGHWNAIGHRVAGELIARKLCDDVFAK